MRRRASIAALLLAGGAACRRAPPPEPLTVFAAASLTEALREIGALHERATGQPVTFSFAASSLLARQIREGAPADLFLSADDATMDNVEGAGLLAPGTRTSVLANRLAVVVPAGSSLAIARALDLARPEVKTVALADPARVPAGIYARVWLERQGVWAAVSPRVVPAENVRAALAAVESGNADAGIVYVTDAAVAKSVRVALEVPDSEGPPISYPFAVLRDAPHPDAARRFLERLRSEEALSVFRKHGFRTKI